MHAQDDENSLIAHQARLIKSQSEALELMTAQVARMRTELEQQYKLNAGASAHVEKHLTDDNRRLREALRYYATGSCGADWQQLGEEDNWGGMARIALDWQQ